MSLKQVELASRSLSVSLLVEVSRAVFLKVGNIAPVGAKENQGAKSKRGRKRRRGAIAHAVAPPREGERERPPPPMIF